MKYSKLSHYELKKIIRCFVVDLTALQTSKITGFNRNTINRYYNIFRQCIYKQQCNKFKEYIGRDCEYDESFRGPKRIRGRPGKSKRGRGTTEKIVFGIYEREGGVFTELIPDASSRSISSIVRGHTDIETIIRTDKWKGYDGLVDVAYNKRLRVNHSKGFVNKKTHINGIEAYRSFSRRRMAKFNGVSKNFIGHLKECERRYLQDDKLLCKHLLFLIKKYHPS